MNVSLWIELDIFILFLIEVLSEEQTRRKPDSCDQKKCSSSLWFRSILLIPMNLIFNYLQETVFH